jgi:alpha-tubulin suppressor-like RCC1 family protein
MAPPAIQHAVDLLHHFKKHPDVILFSQQLFLHSISCSTREGSFFGGLMTWGRNSSLQLGFESDGSVFDPTLLSFQSIRAIQVACGEDFTALLSGT